MTRRGQVALRLYRRAEQRKRRHDLFQGTPVISRSTHARVLRRTRPPAASQAGVVLLERGALSSQTRTHKMSAILGAEPHHLAASRHRFHAIESLKGDQLRLCLQRGAGL